MKSFNTKPGTEKVKTLINTLKELELKELFTIKDFIERWISVKENDEFTEDD